MSELDMVILLALVLVVFVAVVIMKAATLRAQRKVLASMHATLAAIEANQEMVRQMRDGKSATSAPNRWHQP